MKNVFPRLISAYLCMAAGALFLYGYMHLMPFVTLCGVIIGSWGMYRILSD